MKLFLYVLVTIFLIKTAHGQEKRSSIDKLLKKELRFLFVPSVSVSPEVGIMFGGYLDYYYNAGGKKDTITRPSVSFVDFQYSTRRQMNLEFFNSTFTKGEKYFLFTRAGYYRDYEQYWGETAPTLRNEDYITARFERFQALGRITKNIGNKTFVGLGFQYNKFYNIAFGATERPDFIPPNPESNMLGGGLVFNIDKRNSQFSPSQGMYVEFSNAFVLNLQNKQYAFSSYNLDLRKYNEWNKHIWASQLLVGSQFGDVPTFEKIRLGGANLMRGFFKGRYRDKNIWSIQSEYRYALFPALKIVGFAAVGNTAPTLTSLFQQELLLAGGTGLRFRLNKKKQVYARFDVAYTNKKDLGYYLRISDAF